MMIPSPRLLLWVGLWVPLYTFAPFHSAILWLAIGMSLMTVMVALWDARNGRILIAGCSVRMPTLARFSKDLKGELILEVTHPSTGVPWLRTGLPLPTWIQSEQETVEVHPVAGSARSNVSWICRADSRGVHRIEHWYLEIPSPLSLWEVRTRGEGEMEIRVYPDLRKDRKQLAAVFLNRGASGSHAQRIVGQGREFEKLREYLPGDSYDQIHWKSTAKRGKPVTKLFRTERTQEIYVVLDHSRLSGRKMGADPVLERFLAATLSLGLACEKQGDLFGFLTYSDRVKHFIRARNGKGHYDVVRDRLYLLETEDVSPDFAEVASFIRLKLRRRALIVFMTDLSDPVFAEDMVENMALISRQHLVLVVGVKHPEIKPVFAGEDAVRPDDVYRALGGHLLWQHQREWERHLNRVGVRMLTPEDEWFAARVVTEYLKIKQRQLL